MELTKNLFAQIEGHINAYRVLRLIGEITPNSISSLAEEMVQLDFLEVQPITVWITSPGGDIAPAYYLKDVIDGLNSPVHGLVIGKASSAAVDVLQMCTKRMMLPHSELFCHYIRCGGYEIIGHNDAFSDLDAQAIVKHAQGHKHFREKLFSERTGKTIEEIRRIFYEGEMYRMVISSQEAKDINLIDEIVTDFKFFPEFKGKYAHESKS